MGRKSRQSFLKRLKEKKRQDKAAYKRERRVARKQEIRATALVLVGLQNDFFPGGALEAPGGDDVLPVAHRLIEAFSRADLPIVATRDIHPLGHCSFTDQGGSLPPHCVIDTPGAEFHPELRLPSDATIITLGAEPDADALSGFHETHLANRLRALEITKIVIYGLATDHCVKATAVDGRREEFAVTVVQEGIPGEDEQPEGSAEALAEMQSAGVEIVSVDTLIGSPMP